MFREVFDPALYYHDCPKYLVCVYGIKKAKDKVFKTKAEAKDYLHKICFMNNIDIIDSYQYDGGKEYVGQNGSKILINRI